MADTTVGFILFTGMEELDFVGPWEMFSIWRAYANGPKCINISESVGEVRCAKGLRICADFDSNPAPNWTYW
jgi:hypothetical protein